MSNLVFRPPRYYQDNPQVSELERVLEEQTEALCVFESDILAQLWVNTATWGLDLRERWAGLPISRTRSYSYRKGRTKAKLRGQGATTAEMLRSMAASSGLEPSQISVIEHPAEYQFEIVLSNLASVPSDVGGIEATVNEIKPAHLDYRFTYKLTQLLTVLRTSGGLWSIRTVILPPMEEEQHVRIYHYHRRQGLVGPGVSGGGANAHRGVGG